MNKNIIFPIFWIVCLLMIFSIQTWAQTRPILETFTNIGPYNAEQTTITSDINVAGNVAFVNNTSNRVAIEDLQLSAYSTDPLLSAVPGSVTGLDYDIGEGPSEVKNFEVSGQNLSPSVGNIFITAPIFFKISTDNIMFGASTIIPYAGGSLSSTPIYVRLMEGLPDDTYSGNISIESGTAPDVLVYVEGTVSIPVVAPDLIISEVADPGDNANARFVELYNNGATTIDFNTTTIYLARYANGGTNPQTVQLTGSLVPDDFYVIATHSGNFNSAYGTTADLASGIITGNGNDTYVLYIGGDETSGTLFDIYGQIGTDGSGKDWEYE